MTRGFVAWLLVAVALGPVLVSVPVQAQDSPTRSVQLFIPAVGQRADGSLFGVASTLRVTMQAGGTGLVFVSTEPLAQVDMQASARLAVSTASAVTGVPVADRDFFISIKTDAPIIGGPSAGGAMAVAAAALLMGWDVGDDVVMTGMINPDASIGPIGGILQKVDAAADVGARRFLIPVGQGTVLVTTTETVETPSGPAKRSVQRQVEVAEYARDNYGIEVLETTDLYEAVGPFTGHRLVRPRPTIDPLQDPVYTQATRLLADSLADRAADAMDAVTAEYDSASSRMEAGDRDLVTGRLESAQVRLDGGDDASAAGQNYLAASQRFQAMVELELASAVLGYYREGAPSASVYVSQYVEETRDLVDATQEQLEGSLPFPVGMLDARGAAEVRFLEAVANLEAAAQSAAQRNFGDALASASFARQRAFSVEWWLAIGQETDQGSTPVTSQELGPVVERQKENVRLALQYGELILGPGHASLSAALQAHDRAVRAEEEGLAAAAVVELVDALARLDSALVSVAGTAGLERRLDVLRDAAAFEVQVAASSGVAPVYSISLMELAGSVRGGDPAAAYTLFSAARMTVRAMMDAAGIQPPAPRVEPYEARTAWAAWLVVLLEPPFSFAVLAVTVAGTALVGAIVVVVASRPRART